MATLSVGSGNYIRPFRKVRVRHFRVDASQTIRIGDPIVLSADSDEGDRVKLAATDPATDRAFLGFAAEAIVTGASPTADQKIPVWLATQDAEFLVHVANAQTLDNDDISVEYGIVADGTNLIYRLDRTETTAKVFRVLELPGQTGDASKFGVHGDVNGAYVVMCIAPERLYHD